MFEAEHCQVFAHSAEQAHAVHERIRGDRALLQRLQFQGVQVGLHGTYYELRCCPGCASTINAEISAGYALALLTDHANVLARTLGQLDRLPDAPLGPSPLGVG